MFAQVAAVLADELNRLLKSVPTSAQLREHDRVAREFVTANEAEIHRLIQQEKERSSTRKVGFNQENVYKAFLPRLLATLDSSQYKQGEGPLY